MRHHLRVEMGGRCERSDFHACSATSSDDFALVVMTIAASLLPTGMLSFFRCLVVDEETGAEEEISRTQVHRLFAPPCADEDEDEDDGAAAQEWVL